MNGSQLNRRVTEPEFLPDVIDTSLDSEFHRELRAFNQFGKQTQLLRTGGRQGGPPTYVNEFWTSRQRASNSLHEISYRACFKAELVRFFVQRLSKESDWVYDPFAGRGTTALETALLGRRVIANDINPLSRILTEPRLNAPSLTDVQERLSLIKVSRSAKAELDLSMFFHRKTEAEIVSLRNYLQQRLDSGKQDHIDQWIRMVATNRLTGHAPGFFSVYTFPPNQAVSAKAQSRINKIRRQRPEYRDTEALIIRKTRALLRNLDAEARANLGRANAKYHQVDARNTIKIPDGTVQLTVTSPPFLDVVNYAEDNWLRCWFNGIDAGKVAANITMSRSVDQWSEVMRGVFVELFRLTRRGGWIAFEVGEVRRGKIRLDEHVLPIGTSAGFLAEAILINSQKFTKTSHIWGIDNNQRGTNTNRIVVFRKP